MSESVGIVNFAQEFDRVEDNVYQFFLYFGSHGVSIWLLSSLLQRWMWYVLIPNHFNSDCPYVSIIDLRKCRIELIPEQDSSAIMDRLSFASLRKAKNQHS